MEKKNNLCEKLQKFAVDVILFLRTVKNTVETIDMKRGEYLVKESSELKLILASIINNSSYAKCWQLAIVRRQLAGGSWQEAVGRRQLAGASKQ